MIYQHEYLTKFFFCSLDIVHLFQRVNQSLSARTRRNQLTQGFIVDFHGVFNNYAPIIVVPQLFFVLLHPFPQLPLDAQADTGFCRRTALALKGLHQEAVFAAFNGFRNTTHRSGDHRQACCKCFQDSEWVMLIEGGEGKDVCGLVEFWQFLVWIVTCEDNVVFYA